MASKLSVDERLFIGKYPAGLVYADRGRERHGDYARCAFLSYATLVLEVEKDCPAELRPAIEKNAAAMQARRGEIYGISACAKPGVADGQSVLLGSALPPTSAGAP